jgi:hypothetical protein
MNPNISVSAHENAHSQHQKKSLFTLIWFVLSSFASLSSLTRFTSYKNKISNTIYLESINLHLSKLFFTAIKIRLFSFFQIKNPQGNKPDYIHEEPNYKHALYLLFKSISAGVFLLLFTASVYNLASIRENILNLGIFISLLSWLISVTVVLSGFKNFNHFQNFVHHSSKSLRIKLTSYILLTYGVFIILYNLSHWLNWETTTLLLFYFTSITAFIISISHNFLSSLGHSKLFWKSYIGSIYLLNLSFLTGASTYSIIGFFVEIDESWQHFSYLIILFTLFANFFLSILVYFINSPRIKKIHLLRGNFKFDYKNLFWIGSIFFGNIIPYVILLSGDLTNYNAVAGLLVLIGVYFMPE